jgi:hypothetical protein
MRIPNDIIDHILSYIPKCNYCDKYQIFGKRCLDCDKLSCSECNQVRECESCLDQYCIKCCKFDYDKDNKEYYCESCTPFVKCSNCEKELVNPDICESCTDCSFHVCKKCEWSIEHCSICGDQFCDDCRCECN